MLIVAALGGSRTNVTVAVAALAKLACEHQLVVTNGNAPQVDLLTLHSEAFRDVRTYPLDLLDARDGFIGAEIERELGTLLGEARVASLITRTVVDVLDPAFRSPATAVGRAYSADDARALADERGWSIAEADGEWRRVVASPTPRSIVELPMIRLLLERGVVVVCAGGGVPVVVDSTGARHGVEAVVDDDLAAALLARRLDADLLLLFTPAGSGPSRTKIDAATNFARCTGKRAMIGALDDLAALVAGTGGTCIQTENTASPT